MKIFEEIRDLKAHLRSAQQAGARIGFVPTMGALHEGHLSLVALAKTKADLVVASIFVNPTQFGPNEDLDRYPRDRAGDTQKLAEAGCAVLFHPCPEMIYPPGHQTRVLVEQVTEGLCGAHRPGHFNGVTTVVLSLFSIVRPDVAVFGEKDYQQLATLRTMAKDLHLDVEVVGAPLIREPDGLARSSRNIFLSPEDRARARSISQGLFRAREAYEGGERQRDALLAHALAPMTEAQVEPEYLELRHADSLAPLDRADGPSVLLVAAPIGPTRLIDNVILARS